MATPGTIAGTSLLVMSTAPGPTGLNSLGNVQPVYVCQNPGGATVQGLVLTNTLNYSVTLTIWKCAFNTTPFTGTSLWSGTLAAGVSQTITGVLLANGDSIVAQASYPNVVSIEVDGQLGADPVSQQLMAQNLMLNQAFGSDIPSTSEIAALAESTP
jgi:hypothetical protein